MTARFRYDEMTGLFFAGERGFPCERGKWGLPYEGYVHRPFRPGEPPNEYRQVYVKTETGYVLSCIWGSGTYSSNYFHPHGYSWERSFVEDDYPDIIEEPTAVEIGVFRGGGEGRELHWVNASEKDHNDPLPHVEVPQFLVLVALLSSFSSGFTAEDQARYDAFEAVFYDRQDA